MMQKPSPKHPNCIKCGLWENCKSPFMEPSGSDKPDIMVIGEAPGEEEDYRGIQFVGKSGRLLRQVIEEVGFDSTQIRFSNIVRCRPPNNKLAKKHINYCAQFTIDDIKETNPPLVFLFGGSPLNGVLGQSGISRWNGVVIEKDDRTYVPLYHPAYILRNDTVMDEWLSGMLNAVDGTEKKVRFTRTFPKTIDDVLEMRDHLLSCEYIAYDTETTSLDAYSYEASIVVVSFAGGDRSYSLPLHHKESWWSPVSTTYKEVPELDTVIDIVLDILYVKSGFIIGQNLKYDQMMTHACLGMDFEAGGDSMLVSHMLDSRLGIHGLKRLASIHLGMYEYEQELTDYIRQHPEANPDRGGNYGNIPLDILLPYAAMDAEATLMVHDKLYPQMSEKQQILYDQMILSASDVLCEMQCNGMVVDSYIADRYFQIYSIKQKEVYEKILTDKKVKAMVKARQKDNEKYWFNPNSWQQLGELYYDRYKMPPVKVRRSDGSESVTTSGGKLKHLEHKFPILSQIRYYKLLGKMMSTYLGPAAKGNWLSDDGRARTTYNQHGTVTGRLSSSDKRTKLNMQNIPTKEKEPGTLLEILPIKNVFTHSYVRPARDCILRYDHGIPIYDFGKMYNDGVVMSVDYSGMELRIFASAANCKGMIDIHKSGKDFHSCVAIRSLTGKRISKITFDDIAKLDKAVRYRYKWTNWTLLYGGDANTLHHLYDVPYDEAEQVITDYFDAFPEVRYYQDWCVEFAEDHGYIESPYGRREKLFYINDPDQKKRNKDRRSAMNMPVQSAASDTLLIALIIIADKMKEGNFKSKLVTTVHDSIVLDVPRDEVVTIGNMCIDVMENVVKYAGEYMPDIDMSWLICPLKADADVGSHYGTMVSLEKWMEINV